MPLVRTYRPASAGLRALQTLIDVLVGGVIVFAVFAIFAWLTLLLPLDVSIRQYGTGACTAYRVCAPPPGAEPNPVPVWYGLLVLTVALVALALASGALDSEGRTAGMRVMNVLPRRTGTLDTAEARVPRLRLVLRWWLVGALAVAGSWLIPGAGGLVALVVGWLVVLAPGRRTLWDRATGLSVVEVRVVTVDAPDRGP
jgi:hypothetical protein